MGTDDQALARSGLISALGAHLVWGLLPFYLTLVSRVPIFEFVGWRVVFSLPFCLLFIALRRQGGDLIAILRQPRLLAPLVLSASLIGGNWLIYVAAIHDGHVFAASFGYYLTPLIQVLAGTLFLGEKLNARQWAAVALAALGVALLAWGPLEMLWISLALALSWSSYGLIRKLTPVGALPGLTVETLVLAPLGTGIALWYAASPAGSSFGHEAGLSALIVLSGLLTAIPLTLFAIAARRLDFSMIGMLQFTSPTLVFILGVTLFGLPLAPAQLAAFAIIWAAIGLFVWDLLARRRSALAA
jgi:chloramphenicol-sensitive protein RarD